MAADLHLCPCCASHLRVPEQLHVMRCDNCGAELVFLHQGGVRGLALLPALETPVPYSDPRRRVHNIDGHALLESRRAVVLQAAERKRRFWSAMFFACMALLGLTVFTGLGGADTLLHGSKERLETSVLLFMGAVVTLPVLAYVALYFHGRAKLVAESVRRWR
jgi:hypothetical protein